MKQKQITKKVHYISLKCKKVFVEHKKKLLMNFYYDSGDEKKRKIFQTILIKLKWIDRVSET